MNQYLTSIGYQTFLFTDEDKNINSTFFPTHNNILRFLLSLSSKLNTSDKLFFYFSGHGGQLRDYSGDEFDKLDECIYIYNDSYKVVGLSDDILNKMFASIKQKINIRCFFDCCHSGTILDLPFRALFEDTSSKCNFITESKSPCIMDILCISGCMDSSVSHETLLGDQIRGVLTTIFLDCVRNKKDKFKTWSDLLILTSKNVKFYGFSQIPQICFANKSQQSLNFDLM
jgi:hypothetical protein